MTDIVITQTATVIFSAVQTVISYNGKTVLLGLPTFSGDSLQPVINVRPHVPRSINQTLVAQTETLRRPRVDVSVSVQWTVLTGAALRVQLDNWWQWAQQGNDWSLAIYQDYAVETTLSGMHVAGLGAVTVADTTGINPDQKYAIIGGPNYQVVTVEGILGNELTLSDTLDFTFADGSRFRDIYFWNGTIRDENAPSPIHDAAAPADWFSLFIEFVEKAVLPS